MDWMIARLHEMVPLSSIRNCSKLCAARMLSKIYPHYIRNGWVWINGRKEMHVGWNKETFKLRVKYGRCKNKT